MTRISFTALLLLAGLPIAVAAQQKAPVRVTDQTGAAIRDAQISLLSAHGDMLSATTSDAAGQAGVQCRQGSLLQIRALGFESRTTSLRDCQQELLIKLSPASVQTTLNVVVTTDSASNELTGTSDSISRTTARTVFDAVEDLSPGIFVTRRGVMGYGISTNGTGAVNIRGVGGSPNTDVLVVLDGRPDFQGEMGHTLPDFYSLTDAGSIRVLEGPASVLYGSNAMGGAIEIQPREPAQGAEFELTSSLGSYMTGQHRLYTGLRHGRSLYTFSTGINHTDGDRSYSAYHSQDGSLGAERQLSSVWNASLHGNYGHFLVDDPGPINPPYPEQNQASVGRGGLTADLGNSTAALSGYTRFYSTWGHNIITGGFNSTDRITGGRIFETWTTKRNLAVDFGGDFVNYGGLALQLNPGTATTYYGGSHQIDDDAGFMRAHFSPTARTVLNAGVRYQQNSQFGGIVVPEFGALWHVNSRFTFSASASRGFRNPSIRELYLFPAPNPNLTPEHEWNYEATVQARLAHNIASTTTVYYANLTNQILTLGSYPNLTLLNGGSAINKGVETNLRWAFHRRLSATGGYAYLYSTNIAPLVPGNKANLGVDVDLRRAFLHIGVQAVGRRITDASPASLGGYTEASMKLSIPITRRLNFFGTVDNLLDHRYQVLTGYPMPGINGAGGFVLHF